jgi:hypothetical protein
MMKKIFLILTTLLIVSCSGNSVYFDLHKKNMISCDNLLISKVKVEGLDDNFDYYVFSLKSNNNIGVKLFNLTKISDAFSISTTSGKIINNSEFKLKPSSRYKISNISNGDATQFSITIITNENGNIVKASNLDCN